jgi:hypothetical protein
MNGSVAHRIALGVVVLSTLACSKKTPEPTAETKKATPVAAKPAAPQVAPDGKLDPNDPKHGTRKLMGLDAPVYVDGVQTAVLRRGELPPIQMIESEEGGKRWRVADYLEGIGVPVASIKSVHFHGNGDKIASVEGSELRKEKDRFVFSFISGETGTPLQKWDTEKLKNEFSIHEIRRVTVYVKKASPTIHAQKQCHVGADGDCTDAIPYATGEVAKGTRLYIDGKMIGFVKRRQMGDGLVMGELPGGDRKFSLSKLVGQMGVDPAGIKHIEVMAGDDVIGRADGEQFTALSPTTYFTLPQHNHGKVRLHVPAELQARQPGVADKDALVSAVLLYKNTKPTERDLVGISEDTDLSVQVAAIDDARGRLGRGEQ